MNIYKVGEKNDYLKGDESAFVTFDNTGMTYCIRFENPTQKEIKAFNKKGVKYAILDKNNLLYFMLKIGELEYQEALLATIKKDVSIIKPKKKEGYSCVVIFCDTTGKVHGLELVSLHYNDSIKVYSILKRIQGKEIDYEGDYNNFLKMRVKYNTQGLIDIAQIKNIKGGI